MDEKVFTVLNLTIALAVPFASGWFSIWATQRQGQKDARQRDARSVFLRINQHTQQYKLAMLRFHRATFEQGVTPEARAKARSTTAHEFWTIHTALDGDILLLHFIFGKRAEVLVESLHDMMTMYEAFDLEKVPDFEAFNERTSVLIHKAADAMNELWKAIA